MLVHFVSDMCRFDCFSIHAIFKAQHMVSPRFVLKNNAICTLSKRINSLLHVTSSTSIDITMPHMIHKFILQSGDNIVPGFD